MGGGDGTFAQSFQTQGSGYGFAKLRDLDNDGRLDLLFVSGPACPPYDFFTARGNGDGTFQQTTRWPVGTCGSAHPGAFDLDGDGDLDVVNTEDRGCPSVPLAGRRLFISLNNGTGTFQPATSVEAGIFPRNVAAGDFDEDGNLDLVTTANGTEAYLRGNGDGTFWPWQGLAVDLSSDNILVGDWDADGHLDVAALGNVTDGVTALALLWGTGTGTFASTLQGNHPAVGSRIVVASGDLEGDGDLDFMIDGVQDALVFVNGGSRSFDYQGRYGLGNDSRAINYADVTGDGIGDLIAIAGLDSQPSGLYDGLIVLSGLGDVATSAETWPEQTQSRPGDLRLGLVTPNPFQQRARYSLQADKSQHVSVELYDVSGRRVRTLHEGWVVEDVLNEFELDTSNLASGVYWIRARGETFGAARRAVLLK